MPLLITNKRPRLVGLPPAPEAGKPRMKLLPGTQEIDPVYWAEIKHNHGVKLMLRARDLVVKEGEADPPPSPEDLDSFSDADLRELSEDTDTPVTWFAALETELAERKAEKEAALEAKHGSTSLASATPLQGWDE